MRDEVINLGNLATEAELEAAKHAMGSAARLHLLNLAHRYREAQYEVLASGNYLFADVLREEGIDLASHEPPVFTNVLQFVAWYFAILGFCAAAVMAVHHIWF